MASTSRLVEDNPNQHYLTIIQSLNVEKAIRQQNDLFLRQKIASIEAELKETQELNKTLGYCNCCRSIHLDYSKKRIIPILDSPLPDQGTKSLPCTMTRYS